MNNIAVSIVRTFVPYLVGLLAANGLELDQETIAGVTGAVAFVISLAYYIVVRLLEKKFPQIGFLLGVPAKPTYKEVK